MAKINHSITNKIKRTKRVRAKTKGTAERPRLHVHRTNQHIVLQVIDDVAGKTLAAASDLGKETKIKGTKSNRSTEVANALAKQLKSLKITKLVFDRGSKIYHGRIRVVAEAMREQGINV